MLYELLKRCVSVFFNMLNVLLGGHLPPWGCAAVIVEERDHYLVVELPRGRVVFPGGFMTWREDPKHTAQREAQEETGLLVRVDHLNHPASWRLYTTLGGFIHARTSEHISCPASCLA